MEVGEVAGEPESPVRVASAASLRHRLAAGVMDQCCDWSPLLVVALLSRSIHGAALAALVGLGAIGVLAIVVVNEVVSVARTGQSIGKRWLGIQIVDAHTMVPPGLGQVIWRYGLRSIQFGLAWHPFGGLSTFMIAVGPWPVICYAPAVVDQRWHRGLHDRWAHTVVIDVSWPNEQRAA